jgi:hypothetical protein
MSTDRFHAQETHPSLTLPELEYQTANWRVTTPKLLWFLRNRDFERCGAVELRSFFVYLNSVHKTRCGRWGNFRRKRPRHPVHPVSARFYYDELRKHS